MKRASKGNAVDFSAPPIIVPRNNHAGTELVLVVVAQLSEDGSGVLCRGVLAGRRGEELEVVVDDIGDGLCVGCGAGPAAPYRVVDLCELVSHSVGDIGSGRCAAVCSEDNAVVELGCHAEWG